MKKNDLRQIDSFRLKLSGLSYRQIAEELNCSVSTAFSDVRKELQRITHQERLSLSELRRLEIERIEKIAGLLMRALEGDGEIKAAQPLLKAIELKSNLAGLSPKKLGEIEAIEVLVGAGLLTEKMLLEIAAVGTAYQNNLTKIFEEQPSERGPGYSKKEG